MTALDHEVGDEDLDLLRAAFPPEWREEPLGREGVQTWESEHGLRLPEPFRTFVAEISNGSALRPPEDGGLLPLGWLTPGWPDHGERVPAAPFPLQDAWPWEGREMEEDAGQRIVDVFNHGSVVLGTDDELSYWVLVVTAPQRGKVWLLTDVGVYPYPHPAPEALGFAEWVQHWKTHKGWWD